MGASVLPSAMRTRHAVAFMFCPADEFQHRFASLERVSPNTDWDLICYYQPDLVPARVRIIRPRKYIRFAVRLWLLLLVKRPDAVYVASASSERAAAHPLVLDFVRLLPAARRAIVDGEGHVLPLAHQGWTGLGSLLLTTLLLIGARLVTRFGLKAAPERKSFTSRAGRVGITVPVMPDLSHTFVYREVLELTRRHPDYMVLVLEPGDPSVTHQEAAELMKSSEVVPKLSANRYLAMYLGLWLRHPVRMADLLRFIGPHTASYGPGARPNDPYCFLRIEHLHQTNDLTAALMFASHVRKRGVGYLHTYGSTYPAVRTLVAHRLLGIPFSLSTFVDYDYVTAFHMLHEKFSAARFVVVCTEYCSAHLAKMFPDLADRFFVIHHSLRPDYSLGKSFRPRDGRSRLIYVGRFVPKKGLDILITACAILKEQGKSFTCHLYGDGALKADLRGLAERLGVSDVVTFEQPVPNERLYSVMNEDDIFVCPSRYVSDGERDGIPVSLMEAMAGGITVVSTPVSGIPELIADGQNGYLVPADDPQVLASMLDGLISHSDRRTVVAAAARATIATRFSSDEAGGVLDGLINRETRSLLEASARASVVPRAAA
jgi:colanic acid/amylovoran biosynthesis glycosyltransferase